MTREERKLTQKRLKRRVEEYVELVKNFHNTDISKISTEELDYMIKQQKDMEQLITITCLDLQGYEFDPQKAYYIKKD